MSADDGDYFGLTRAFVFHLVIVFLIGSVFCSDPSILSRSSVMQKWIPPEQRQEVFFIQQTLL